jgi:hypothetical protein
LLAFADDAEVWDCDRFLFRTMLPPGNFPDDMLLAETLSFPVNGFRKNDTVSPSIVTHMALALSSFVEYSTSSWLSRKWSLGTSICRSLFFGVIVPWPEEEHTISWSH